MIDATYIISTVLTIAIFSWTFKRTIVSEIAERTMVGVAAGYTFTVSLRALRDITILPLLGGKITYIIPIIFGVLMYTTLISKYRTYSRLSTILLIGIGLGVSLGPLVKASILEQLIATVSPPADMTPLNIFNYIVILLGVVTVLVYFVFTREFKGPLKGVPTYARYAMMLAFGANFANYMLSTQMKLIDRFMAIVLPLLGQA